MTDIEGVLAGWEEARKGRKADAQNLRLRVAGQKVADALRDSEAARDKAEQAASGRKLQMHEYRTENEFMKKERKRAQADMEDVRRSRDAWKQSFETAKADLAACLEREAQLREFVLRISEHPVISDGGPDQNCDWHCTAIIAAEAKDLLASSVGLGDEPA